MVRVAIIFLLARNVSSVMYSKFAASVNLLRRDSRLVRRESHLVSCETQFFSREKRDETGNLLLSGTVLVALMWALFYNTPNGALHQ